jgi:hypothetical protein
MKNKFFQYLLIVLVLLVWSIIFLKIFKRIKGTDDFSMSNNTTLVTKAKLAAADTFFINSNYGNPFVEFIGDEMETAKENTDDANAENNTYVAAIPVNWPKISYSGIIVNKKNVDFKVALMKIENSDYLVKKNDIVKDIKVNNLFSDSITLTYKGALKTFKKNE